MADVLFYEKPGCANNRRQRKLLEASGHRLTVCDLLSTPWQPESLLPFLQGKPIETWFNRASPRIKSGEVDPCGFDADSALALLIRDPLLIRRPLIQIGEWRAIGFDLREVAFLLGQVSDETDKVSKLGSESCHRKNQCTITERKLDP